MNGSGKGLTRRQALLGLGGALIAPSLIKPARAADASKVTIYSSVPSAYMNKLADAFNAERTGITLSIYTAATFQTVERLQAEIRANRVSIDH